MNSIAIDGPAGAGKSTIAKEIAKRLNIIYLDTGALYRAVGLYMIKNGVDLKKIDRVVFELQNCKISVKHFENNQKVLLCGEDVGDLIRSSEVSMAASAVSAIREVREYLLDLQRNIAKNNDVIMDGRDIGTVVLPDANVKIFLTASINSRAKRRFCDLIEMGQEVKFEDVLEHIKQRDSQDMNRKFAPLKPAPDAVLLDTSNLSLEESVENVLEIIKKNGVEKNK